MFLEGGGAGQHIVARPSRSWVAEGGAVSEGKVSMGGDFLELFHERFFLRYSMFFPIFLMEDRLVCSDEIVCNVP